MMMMMKTIILGYFLIRATTEQTNVLEVLKNYTLTHARLHGLSHLPATVTVPA
jgi:hypothetical protein